MVTLRMTELEVNNVTRLIEARIRQLKGYYMTEEETLQKLHKRLTKKLH